MKEKIAGFMMYMMQVPDFFRKPYGGSIADVVELVHEYYGEKTSLWYPVPREPFVVMFDRVRRTKETNGGEELLGEAGKSFLLNAWYSRTTHTIYLHRRLGLPFEEVLTDLLDSVVRYQSIEKRTSSTNN